MFNQLEVSNHHDVFFSSLLVIFLLATLAFPHPPISPFYIYREELYSMIL